MQLKLPMLNVGGTSEEHSKRFGINSEEFRNNFGITSEEHRFTNDAELSITQLKIIEILSSDSMMTSDEMAKQIGISRRSIENNIKKLKEMGLLMRHGSKKNGYWEVVK